MVKQLVAMRVDLEVSSPRREGTALHIATHNAHSAVLKVLLSARAHVDALTDSMDSAAQGLPERERQHSEAVVGGKGRPIVKM